MAEAVVVALDPQTVTYHISELKTDSVTVYPDKAEVTRVLTVKVEREGDMKVNVRGLSEQCDLETVR